MTLPCKWLSIKRVCFLDFGGDNVLHSRTIAPLYSAWDFHPKTLLNSFHEARTTLFLGWSFHYLLVMADRAGDVLSLAQRVLLEVQRQSNVFILQGLQRNTCGRRERRLQEACTDELCAGRSERSVSKLMVLILMWCPGLSWLLHSSHVPLSPTKWWQMSFLQQEAYKENEIIHANYQYICLTHNYWITISIQSRVSSYIEKDAAYKQTKL